MVWAHKAQVQVDQEEVHTPQNLISIQLFNLPLMEVSAFGSLEHAFHQNYRLSLLYKIFTIITLDFRHSDMDGSPAEDNVIAF